MQLAQKVGLQLVEGLGQVVALGEELAPLSNVGSQQRRLILVCQDSLEKRKATSNLRAHFLEGRKNNTEKPES